MTHTPETLSQTGLTEKRAEIESELRLAREYWRIIRDFLKGRILRREEFFVAQHAIRNLKRQRKMRQSGMNRVPFRRMG